MPTRRASAASEGRARRVPLPVVLALMSALVALAALVGGGRPRDVPPRAVALPFDGRSPVLGARRVERVLVRLSRPALGELRTPLRGSAARRYVASEHAEGRALRGGLRARGVAIA